MSLTTETTRLDNNMEAVIQTCKDFKTTFAAEGIPTHVYTKTTKGTIVETLQNLPFTDYPQAISDYLDINSLPYFMGQKQYILYKNKDSSTDYTAMWTAMQSPPATYTNARVEYANAVVGMRFFGINNSGSYLDSGKEVSPMYGVGMDDLLTMRLDFASTNRPLPNSQLLWFKVPKTNPRWNKTSILHQSSSLTTKYMIDGYIDCFFDVKTYAQGYLNEAYEELSAIQYIYPFMLGNYKSMDGGGNNDYYLKHPIPFCFLYDKSCLSSS